MLIKNILFFCLLILGQAMLGSMPPLTPGQSKRLSELLNMSADINSDLYNQLIQEEVLPILKAQCEKYHPNQPAPNYYVSARKKYWRSDESSVHIPPRFIADAIKHRLDNSPAMKRDLTFWTNMAFFHHELQHIKAKHLLQLRQAYINGQNILPLQRMYEREADDGIPSYRLILLGIKQFFEQCATGDDPYLGDGIHPSDKDRADRFGQRLDVLLKERAQAVNRLLGLDKLPKIPAPNNMPQASALLNIESEHYETILDVIGEHKAV